MPKRTRRDPDRDPSLRETQSWSSLPSGVSVCQSGIPRGRRLSSHPKAAAGARALCRHPGRRGVGGGRRPAGTVPAGGTPAPGRGAYRFLSPPCAELGDSVAAAAGRLGAQASSQGAVRWHQGWLRGEREPRHWAARPRAAASGTHGRSGGQRRRGEAGCHGPRVATTTGPCVPPITKTPEARAERPSGPPPPPLRPSGMPCHGAAVFCLDRPSDRQPSPPRRFSLP